MVRHYIKHHLMPFFLLSAAALHPHGPAGTVQVPPLLVRAGLPLLRVHGLRRGLRRARGDRPRAAELHVRRGPRLRGRGERASAWSYYPLIVVS